LINLLLKKRRNKFQNLKLFLIKQRASLEQERLALFPPKRKEKKL